MYKKNIFEDKENLNNYEFYMCNKKVISSFKNINFYQKELDYNFILTYKALFLKHKNDKYESMFHNGIISLVNTEEFPYTYETVFNLTMYQFTKSLMQINGKKQACAMLQGSMSGFVDTSKIPSSSFQWMYSDEKYNKRTGKTLKESLAPGGGNLNVKPMAEDALKK